MPLEEIRLVGRIGCPQCVKVFEASILALLEEAQGVSQYKGDLPEAFATISNYQKLRDAYNKAIATDDFIQAKALFEEIKAFKDRHADDANFMRFLENEGRENGEAGE
jgi:protein arginine kinase activator